LGNPSRLYVRDGLFIADKGNEHPIDSMDAPEARETAGID
jgi:hypothetical protein